MIVLAHGLSDAVLPIPTGLAQLVALAAMAAAHVALSRRTARVASASPRAFVRLPAVVCNVGRALTGGAVALAVLASLFGRAFVISNPAVLFLWSVLPAGLLVVTLIAGSAARDLNPLRQVSRLAVDPTPLGDKLLVRIALCGLFTLAWARSAFADETVFTGIVVTGYLFASGAAGAIWGGHWFDRGDPVETAVAALSSGRIPGQPTNGNAAVTLGVVAILIGGAITDSLVETSRVAGLSTNAGLAAVLASTAALVAGAAWLAAPTKTLRPALAPVAMSYLAVHAVAPVVNDTQLVFLQTMAAAGADVVVEPVEFVAPEVLASAGAVLLLAGHLRALVVAHRRAALLPRSQRKTVLPQFAAVAAVSLFTALPLLFGA